MPDLHHRLLADHRRLDGLFTAFANGATSGDANTQAELVAEFESKLLAHFEGEEKYLFPLLVREFPEEVVALRQEHELIRQQLAAIVGDAGGQYDASSAERMVTALRRHAHREDRMLYKIVNDSETSARYRDLMTFLEETYVKLRAVGEDD
ncbi:MAG: hemerythrin domain-containing protein [Polyangiaceae bacterium]|nr:hemerythrin domain-containing protein [Polyangiaceae bacterium]